MSSYGHHARRIAEDHYRLSWTVDFHYPDSRLRHPRIFTRDTDKAAAERFARRWKIAIKGETQDGTPSASAKRPAGRGRT